MTIIQLLSHNTLRFVFIWEIHYCENINLWPLFVSCVQKRSFNSDSFYKITTPSDEISFLTSWYALNIYFTNNLWLFIHIDKRILMHEEYRSSWTNTTTNICFKCLYQASIVCVLNSLYMLTHFLGRTFNKRLTSSFCILVKLSRIPSNDHIILN